MEGRCMLEAMKRRGSAPHRTRPTALVRLKDTSVPDRNRRVHTTPSAVLALPTGSPNGMSNAGGQC